ncbi:hypothetical protein Tco_0564963 [Tanacetum coccineum]
MVSTWLGLLGFLVFIPKVGGIVEFNSISLSQQPSCHLPLPSISVLPDIVVISSQKSRCRNIHNTKGYKCLDPDSSRIYITRHARFDEITFPFASTANPNALSTLQLCTFLEDGPPISDAPVPESRPTHTRPSSLSPCGLCPIPTTPAEPIHGPDLTPSSPYSSEDDNPPTDT